MANEKRLIDANALMDAIWDVEVIDYAKTSADFIIEFDRFLYSLRGLIATAPTVDAVEVVRCKDCKHCRTFFPIKEIGKEAIQVWFCELYRCNRKTDEFCSDGERREGE